jgi:hypothetical protein
VHVRAAKVFAIISSMTACSGVHDLEGDGSPIAVLRGRVAGARPEGSTLRAGLVWAGAPVFVPFCHDEGPTPLDPQRSVSELAAVGCRDPFDVVPELAGTAAAIASDGSFELPIVHLPTAEVMVGGRESRVAYGSLVVFADLDENGALELRGGCGRIRGRMDDPRLRPRAEPIYAASFSTLTGEQARITYVEGELDADSFFYPHSRCRELAPPGFSLWSMAGLLDATDESGACRVDPIDTPIELELGSPEDFAALSCRQAERESFERPPRWETDPLPDDLLWECSDDGNLVFADPSCDCPEVRELSLVGCYDDRECEDPDWDLRDEAQEWWPCSIL